MKKTINKKVYNTDTAKEIDRIAFGTFGDPAGYEEVVYETKRGDRFLYGIGGPDSKYPIETIIVIEEKAVEKKPAAKKTTKK
ncbi:MAG: hypothetical protein IJN39_01645 [Clostridia bacterium]|nr:hypothetical protein [Clostridia bacterium]